MKIGIDCRLSGLAHAGIGRYIENLTKRLPILAPEIEWVFFYRESNQILSELKKLPNTTYIRAPIQHYTLQEQIQLLSIFNQQKLDLLHVPHFNIPLLYQGKMVVTIHDLLWHQHRGTKVTTLKPWKYWFKYFGYRFITKTAIKKAEQLIVPTKTIKQELMTHFETRVGEKTTVTYEGIDQTLLQFKDKKIKAKPKTLIYVGSLYPHKNIQIVLKAIQQLPEWELILVGSRNIFQEQVKKRVEKLGITHQVKFSGYVSDKELSVAIQKSSALVQPSLSEGFGLTGIESLALGTPILASNIAVFKEIYANDATYFDPHSVESFMTALEKLPTKKVATKKTKELIEKYDWDTMAEKTLKEYKKSI